MKLFYHEGANFGDALNVYLFDRLLPGAFNSDDDELFVGIGSLLGLMPAARRRVIFSTGYAAGNDRTYGLAPTLSESDEVLCVRGPLTAQQLGLPQSSAVADGALLLSLLQDTPRPDGGQVAYMPHIGSEHYYDWSKVAQDAGLRYISPGGNVEDVLGSLSGTSMLITEAMHGAIVADTIGLPWIAVRAYPAINSFKWRDWTASIGADYHPLELPRLLDQKTIAAALQSRRLTRHLSPLGVRLVTKTHGASLTRRRHASAVSKLQRIARTAPNLSDRDVILSLAEQLAEKLQAFTNANFGQDIQCI